MSDPLIKKRLYVGGLAENVTEDELKQRFSKFVSVSNLTLKSRTDTEGNHIKAFAHLNIQGTEENVKKCFNAYQNAKWKGCVIKLQDAKENFLERLEAERQEEKNKSMESISVDSKKKKVEWKPPEFKLSGAPVPGTPIPGKKDWVVGKYGRVLPILNVKKSYKTKALKHDPSKFCHAAKVFKEDSACKTSNIDDHALTWEIDTPDSEITKKRKGEFPPDLMPKKVTPFPTHLLTSSATEKFSSNHQRNNGGSNKNNSKKADDGGIEIVKMGQHVQSSSKSTTKSRFDSDYESDNEGEIDNRVVSSTSSKGTVLSSLSSNKGDNNPKKSKNTTARSSEDKIMSHDKVSEKNGRVIPEFKGIGSLISKSVDKYPNSGKKYPDNVVIAKEMASDNNEEDEEIRSDDENISNGGEEVTVKFDNGKESDDDEEEEDSSDDMDAESEASSDAGEEEAKLEFNNQKKESDDEDGDSSVHDADSEKKVVGDDDEVSSSEDDEEEVNNSEGDGEDEVSSSESDEEDEVSSSESDDEDEVSSSENDAVEKSTMNGNVKLPVKSTTNCIKKVPSIPHSNNLGSSISSTDSSLSSSSINKKEKKLKKSEEAPFKPQIIPPPTKKSLHRTNVDLSEFASEAPDCQPHSNASSDEDDDSYDSDLDSNDFRLVAKKLEQKLKQKNKTIAPKENRNKRKISEVTDSDITDGNDNALGGGGKKQKVDEFEAVKGVQHKLLSLASGCTVENDVKTTMESENSSSDQKGSKTKQEIDNAKRLQAVQEQMKIRQRKQAWMKSALKNVGAASSKRIVFSSSDEESDTNTRGENNDDKRDLILKPDSKITGKTSILKVEKPKPSRMTLLGDSSDDSSDADDLEEMFKSKPQFEGKKGEKLMKMQKKFGDARFKLDAKFVDSDESENSEGDDNEEEVEGTKSSNNPGQDVSLAEEKKRNLQVLENVVGKNKVDKLTAKLKRDTIKIVDMNQLRFDPTKFIQSVPEESKSKPSDKSSKQQEINKKSSQDTPAKTSKQDKKQEKESTEESPDASQQEVTKSKVTLSDTLVDMLRMKTKEEGKGGGDKADKGKEMSSFSFLDMFDASKDDEDLNELQSPQKPLAGLLSSKQNDIKGSVRRVEESGSDDEMEVDEVKDNSRSTKISGPKSFMNLREIGDEQIEESEISDNDDKLDKDEERTSTNSNETTLDSVQEQEKALKDAGRVDIRFTKQEWLERFSEIRHDLLLMCKKRYKDARRKKRVEDEHNRKKAVLKKAGKGGGWWKKK